ncbi:MAG: hypothetical protein R2789_15810 [Microthrixaceae bacterium]
MSVPDIGDGGGDPTDHRTREPPPTATPRPCAHPLPCGFVEGKLLVGRAEGHDAVYPGSLREWIR